MNKIYLLAAILLGLTWNACLAQLPQDHPYQKTLRDYIGTLNEKDFEVTLSPLKVKPSYFNSVDDVYKLWLFLGYQQYDMMETNGLRTDASYFTLRSIEAGGKVHMNVGKGEFINAIATAFYADWDFPGNPHFDSRSVKLRAFVAASVDMMMQDQDHERGNNQRSDFLGMQLIRWAYAYGVAKDELPQNVRDAYEKGLIRMFKKLEQWGPTGIHSDMDTGAIVGMLYAAKYVDSQNLTNRAHAYIDRLLKEHFSDAGYIGHGRGYDAGYNGISSYFINWAAQLSGYPPLVNALQKMGKLKAYMTLPDPDGRRFSPSQSNASSGADAPHDLWSPYYRDVGIARYSNDAKYLVYKGDRTNIYSESTMLKRINNSLFYFLDDQIETRGAFDDPSDEKPETWKHKHWIDHDSFNATAFYYKDGLYDKLKTLKNSNSPLTKPPFERKGVFTEDLAEKYLSVKRATYGTIIANDRLSWWTKKGQTKELNGFGGGNLAAFWTPETGSVLLGGSRGTHDSGHDLDEWREWPVHALSGKTSDGRAFSSGLQRYPKASYHLTGETKTVTIDGDLANIYSDPRDGLQGQAKYQRVFKVKSNGVEVTTSVNADGSNTVNELYEILPVYRRNAGRQSSAATTTIEFKVNGNWQQAGTDFKEVSNIRLRRFNGTVYIDFEKSQRVKLSTKDFYQKSEKKSGLQSRNIMIDLLGSGGQVAKLRDASVSYFLRSSKASANEKWTSIEDDDPPSDSTPPSVNVTHTPDNPENSQKITLITNAEDKAGIKEIQLFVDGKKLKTCSDAKSCSVSVGPYKDGTYRYYATVEDKAGNKQTSDKQTITVETDPKDTKAPQVEISHGPNAPDNTQKTQLSATASDASGIKQMQLFVEGEKVKTCSDAEACKVSVGPYNDGTYSYYATAEDKAGNKKTSEKAQFTVQTEEEDNTPPQVELTYTPNKLDDTQKISLSAEAKDASGIKQIMLFVEGDEVKTCDNTETCRVAVGPFEDGTYSYYATAVDKKGNKKKTSTKKITIKTADTDPPKVEVSYKPSDPNDTQNVTFSVSASDDSGIKTMVLYIDDEKQKTCTDKQDCRLVIPPLEAGKHFYSVQAKDNSVNENKTSTKKVSFEVKKKVYPNNPPVTVEASLQKGPQYLKTKVKNVSDPDGDPVNLSYDWRVNKQSIAVVNMSFDVNKKGEGKKGIKNYTSFKNDGVIDNEAAIPDWSADGKKGGALIFDGKDDYIRVPGKNRDKPFQKFTVETWVEPDGWGEASACLISKPISSSSEKTNGAVLELSRNANENQINFKITSTKNKVIGIKSKQNIASQKWTHIAGTYNGKELKLYVNGELEASKRIKIKLANSEDTDIFIAGKSQGDENINHYKGKIDEVRLLNIALSPDEIENHYNSVYNKMALDNTQPGQKWNVAVIANDTKTYTDPATTNVITTTQQKTADSTSISLAQNFPNPFNNTTTVRYDLDTTQKITIKVYTSSGRLVETVFEGEESPGEGNKTFDASHLASGIYFYQLITDSKTITKKMTYIK